jgi:hypothetical protein
MPVDKRVKRGEEHEAIDPNYEPDSDLGSHSEMSGTDDEDIQAASSTDTKTNLHILVKIK